MSQLIVEDCGDTRMLVQSFGDYRRKNSHPPRYPVLSDAAALGSTHQTQSASNTQLRPSFHGAGTPVKPEGQAACWPRCSVDVSQTNQSVQLGSDETRESPTKAAVLGSSQHKTSLSTSSLLIQSEGAGELVAEIHTPSSRSEGGSWVGQ